MECVQSLAVIKGTVADFCQRIRKRDGGEVPAFVEGERFDPFQIAVFCKGYVFSAPYPRQRVLLEVREDWPEALRRTGRSIPQKHLPPVPAIRPGG